MSPKRFKKDVTTYFDYKDVKTLSRYINAYGQIEPIGKTGLSVKQQRQLAVAIKRARHLALLPFVTHGQRMLVFSPVKHQCEGKDLTSALYESQRTTEREENVTLFITYGGLAVSALVVCIVRNRRKARS